MRRAIWTRCRHAVTGWSRPNTKWMSTSTSQHHKHDKEILWQPELVIFDQHGTLVDVHSVWEPWIHNLAQRLEVSSGLILQKKIYKTLDVCHFTKKVRHGVLGEGTTEEIRRYLQRLLHVEGLTWRNAQLAVENAWEDCTSTGYVDEAARNIFQHIKSSGAKIALCSSDDRRATLDTLQNSNLLELVDHVICGDDDHLVTGRFRVDEICASLGVAAERTVVIGDTVEDMEMGREANVALNIGVLSGISTRLNLTGVADIVTEDINDAINYLTSLNHKQIDEISLKRTPSTRKKTDASLVIFDKDGTLLCFHTLWTPWAEDFITKLEAATGLDIKERVLYELGFCTTKRRWRPAVFTEGTTQQSIETVADLLEEEGMGRSDAIDVVKSVWPPGDHGNQNNHVRPLDSPASIFKTLQALDVKVAVCTADCRRGTEIFLADQQASEYVDIIVCGNDPHAVPKPDPHNALYICEKLGVDPAKAIMVGDTSADMEMGRSAKLGATVAVLSGVGDVEHLSPDADHMVPSASYVLDIVTTREYRQYARDIYHKDLKLNSI